MEQRLAAHNADAGYFLLHYFRETFDVPRDRLERNESFGGNRRKMIATLAIEIAVIEDIEHKIIELRLRREFLRLIPQSVHRSRRH